MACMGSSLARTAAVAAAVIQPSVFRAARAVIAAVAGREAWFVCSGEISGAVGVGVGVAGATGTERAHDLPCPILGGAESSVAHAGGRAGEADGAGTVIRPPKAWRSVLECRLLECKRAFALLSISACLRQKAASMLPSVSAANSAVQSACCLNSQSKSRNTACTWSGAAVSPSCAASWANARITMSASQTYCRCRATR